MSRAVAAPGGAALFPSWLLTYFGNAPSARAFRDIVPVQWWSLIAALVVGFLIGYAVWRLDAGVREAGDAGGGLR